MECQQIRSVSLLMSIICILTLVSGQTLFYEEFTDNSFTTDQDWSIVSNGIYSDCGTVRLLGGYRNFGAGGKVMKLFYLPPHHTIQITFEFFRYCCNTNSLDTWDSEYFYVYADAELVFTAQQFYGSAPQNLCGIPIVGDTLTNVNTIFTHHYSSLFIFLTSNLNEPPENESWGMRNFKLYLYLCPPGCHTCNSSDDRQSCLSWIFLEYKLQFLYSENFDGWIIDNGQKEITQCGPIKLLGGFGKTGSNSSIMKQIYLPTHTSIKIKFRFVSIDAWNNKNAYILIDGTQYWTFTYNYNSRTIQNICGDIYDEIFQNQEITIKHSNSQITILFSTDLDQGYNVQSFGIRDIEIFTCNIKTNLVCSAGDNQFCGEQCGNGIKEGNEICDDGNIYPFDGCFNCQYSCVVGCSDCINGICIQCQIGWEFVMDLNFCIPQPSDTIIVENEVCDEILHSSICLDGSFRFPQHCEIIEFGYCKICQNGFYLNDNICEPVCQDLTIVNQIECQSQQDGCNLCQSIPFQGCQDRLIDACLQCSPGWNLILNKCEPICGDQMIQGFEECDFNQQSLRSPSYGCQECKFQCQDMCVNCKYGKCYECEQGWITSNFECVAACGDGIIQGQESCDDENLDHFDGCYQCFNDCQSQCQFCHQGQCLSCIKGWNLSSSGVCVSECGDNQLAAYSQEECDGENGLYGCTECKLQCCPECFLCSFGTCFQCNPTFTLISDQCVPVCGDGIVSIDYEDCDDQSNDGCSNCEYSCLETCQNCREGICFDTCSYGYSLVNQICETICGDKIIAGLEECDDGNNLEFDGCYECYYSCPKNCNYCLDGQCIECQNEFQINQKQNYCHPQCGDGKVAIGIEECDDENTINLDGCLIYCQIEANYLCNNNNTLSECTFVEHPQLKVKFIKQEYQYQYVQIYFTQMVKSYLTESFVNYIELSLDIENQYYDTNITVIQDASAQISEVEYQAIIYINSELTTKPVLEVKLLEFLYNEFDAPLSNLQAYVDLQLPKILSESQQETALKLGKISSNLLSSLGGIGVISLLLGNSFILWEQLEMLQQQSYLRFINVVFPENLFIYFESSNLISLQPVQQFVNLDTMINLIIETPFQESYEKFKYYGIDANILANLKTQILIIVSIAASYAACLIIQKGMNKLTILHFTCLGLFVSKLIVKLRRLVNKFLQQLKRDGIKQICIANIWDLFFISFLQIRSITFTEFSLYLRFIIAILILVFLIMLASQMINRNSLEFLGFKQYWISKQKFFLIFKKLTFIGILVFFQFDQMIQTILLSQVSIIYLVYILAFQPSGDKFESAKLILMEVTVVIFLLTQFIYWDDNCVSYEKQVIFGWFHIALLLSNLIVSLIFQLFHILKKVYFLIQTKIRKYDNKIQEPSSNPFPLSRIK